MALPGSVLNMHSTVTHERYSFTHEDILTSIPSGSVSVAKVNYPIEYFTEAFDAFDVSIEIRERLTRTEVKVFDPTLFTKLYGLKTMSVEGPHYLQLKVLKRLTKAREHLKNRIPSMLEDLNRIVWNLLIAIEGHTPKIFVVQPFAQPLIDVASTVDLVQVLDNMPLSSITVGQVIVERSAGYEIYLRFIDVEDTFEIKGVTAKDDPLFSNMAIKCMDVKCVGDFSDAEVSVGMKDGRDFLLKLRDEQDAALLVKKITQVAGITAYAAHY